MKLIGFEEGKRVTDAQSHRMEAVVKAAECRDTQIDIWEGNIGLEDALDKFTEALRTDLTESDHAAHIRDAIRHSFDDSHLESGTLEQAFENCREIVRVTPSITEHRQKDKSTGVVDHG